MDTYVLLAVGRTRSLAEHLRRTLDVEQYLVRWAPSTSQALALDIWPSLLILDLPPSGGTRSALRLKERFDAPLLALLQPGQAEPDDVDASLRRPFSIDQLAEAIYASLMAFAPHVLQVKGMSLDTRTRRLQVHGDYYQLRPIGCQVMVLLMARAGKAVPRDELFRRIWQTDDGDNTRVLDVHIAHLRNLIEANPRRPKLIVTERRIGYRLQPPD